MLWRPVILAPESVSLEAKKTAAVFLVPESGLVLADTVLTVTPVVRGTKRPWDTSWCNKTRTFSKILLQSNSGLKARNKLLIFVIRGQNHEFLLGLVKLKRLGNRVQEIACY